ncbi:MAG: hypothetical protein ACRENP_11290 [Longimicrobiales bacterium]
MRQQYAILALLLLAACGDAVGPRPRPGAPPQDTSNGSGLAPALSWYATEPRVIVLGSTDSVVLTAQLKGSGSARVHTSAGERFTLRAAGGLHQVVLPVSSLLFDYRPGDEHHLGAQLDIDGQVNRVDLVFNVRDGSQPDAAVRGIAPGVQATDHVINIRLDSTSIGPTVPASIIREVYRHFPDHYDFIAVLEAVRSTRYRTYQGVRNGITGIGLATFDQASQYGSAGALQGVIQYPSDDTFDLAETGNIHEIGHRWINFTRVGMLATGSPHWPLSSLAFGVMGLTDGTRGPGSAFPYRIMPAGDRYQLQAVARARDFNELELYLMGLFSPEQVPPFFVFRNQRLVSQVFNGALLPGPLDTVRVDDVIAMEGARHPAAANAQRTFRMATVVLSRGRLLSRSELSFFDHMAARGEAETELPYRQGGIRGQTRPFFLATGQRARLVTRL